MDQSSGSDEESARPAFARMDHRSGSHEEVTTRHEPMDATRDLHFTAFHEPEDLDNSNSEACVEDIGPPIFAGSSGSRDTTSARRHVPSLRDLCLVSLAKHPNKIRNLDNIPSDLLVLLILLLKSQLKLTPALVLLFRSTRDKSVLKELGDMDVAAGYLGRPPDSPSSRNHG